MGQTCLVVGVGKNQRASSPGLSFFSSAFCVETFGVIFKCILGRNWNVPGALKSWPHWKNCLSCASPDLLHFRSFELRNNTIVFIWGYISKKYVYNSPQLPHRFEGSRGKEGTRYHWKMGNVKRGGTPPPRHTSLSGLSQCLMLLPKGVTLQFVVSYCYYLYLTVLSFSSIVLNCATRGTTFKIQLYHSDFSLLR